VSVPRARKRKKEVEVEVEVEVEKNALRTNFDRPFNASLLPLFSRAKRASYSTSLLSDTRDLTCADAEEAAEASSRPRALLRGEKEGQSTGENDDASTATTSLSTSLLLSLFACSLLDRAFYFLRAMRDRTALSDPGKQSRPPKEDRQQWERDVSCFRDFDAFRKK